MVDLKISKSFTEDTENSWATWLSRKFHEIKHTYYLNCVNCKDDKQYTLPANFTDNYLPWKRFQNSIWMLVLLILELLWLTLEPELSATLWTPTASLEVADLVRSFGIAKWVNACFDGVEHLDVFTVLTELLRRWVSIQSQSPNYSN